MKLLNRREAKAMRDGLYLIASWHAANHYRRLADRLKQC